MDSDDVIYVLVLIVSIALGYVFQNIQDTARKKWFSSITGLAIILLVSGLHAFHAILLVLLIGGIIRLNHRNGHVLSFCGGFGYLVFFRTTEYFGIPHPSSGHTNMIQMVLTLKLVGLAFEIHDNHQLKKRLREEDADDVTCEERYRVFPAPRFADVFHYAFCYAGVLTGPYFTYRSYCDIFLYPRNEWKICLKNVLKTCSYIPLLCAFFFFTAWACPLQALYSREFYENKSVLFRLWYMYPVFFLFRTRMYIAFKLSEAVCIMAGIGMYPTLTKPKLGSGPSTNFEELEKLTTSHMDYNFETVNSMNCYQCEFSCTVREATRHWNRTVQYWLASYVYKRFPFKPWRTSATFFVSSLWHGIYAGYYFSLFSMPAYLFVEDTFRERVVQNDRSILKNFVLWNLKMFQFSYWGLAFQVKNYADVWRFGQSVLFIPYFVVGIMYFYAIVFPKKTM